jgi:hypothetical protein
MDGLMLAVNYPEYDLILSTDPCDIFKHYGVKEMHGLSLKECEAYDNTTEDSYISGWCNLSPSGKPFVFINLSRCTDDVKTTGLVMHEEDIISFAENETYKVVNNFIKCLVSY